MNKLTKFIKILAVSILFAVVSFWANLTKAQEITGILRIDAACVSVKDFQSTYKNTKSLIRQYKTVNGKVSEQVILGLPTGEIVVLKQVEDNMCLVMFFDKQQRM